MLPSGPIIGLEFWVILKDSFILVELHILHNSMADNLTQKCNADLNHRFSELMETFSSLEIYVHWFWKAWWNANHITVFGLLGERYYCNRITKADIKIH